MKTLLFLAAAALAAPPQGALAPRADHHMHLLSPAAAQWITEPQLPATAVPPEIDRLLREREKGWNDKAALARLFTEDSLILSREPHWIRGRAEVTDYLAGLFARPYRITPVLYQAEGSSAHLAGYFTRGEGAEARHFGHFLFSLRKGGDGAWRIAAETPTFPGPVVHEPTKAEQLVAELDAAGAQRGVVLSVAYWYGSPLGKQVEDEYARVKAENDWTAAEVARVPNRLVAFCSVNPLKDYAVEEIGRCAKNPHFKGLKLHLGNSGVDVRNPQHVEKMRQVFRAANDHRLPIVIHLWTLDKTYGREHSEIFLNRIVPAAPDIPIQIAHMAATGPGYHSDDAMEVFANAGAAGDPKMKNVYVDVASMVVRTTPPETLELVAKRLRQVGLQRVLFASDRAGTINDTTKDAWEAFRRLPLTEEEFRTVAGNVAPYLR